MDDYCSIKDSNLAHYFSRPDVFSHLMRMGLVTVDGRVVTDVEWRQAQAECDRRIRIGSPVLQESIDEGGLVKYYQQHKPLLVGPGRLRGQPKRHSVAFILSDGEKVKGGARKKRRKLPDYPIKMPKENVCPLRWTGRLGIAGEPYLAALPPTSRSSTPFSCSSATSRGCVFERLYPEPPDDVALSYRARKSKFPPAILTLQFLGPSRPTELSLLQQPCGTYTIPIFTNIITTGEQLEVTSQRREGCRFSMVICEDGVAISRLSSCCEHRYTSGRRLGGPSGHLRVITIRNGSPCSKCIERVEAAKMKDRYLSSKKAMGNKRRPPSRHPLLLKGKNENYPSESSDSEEESEHSELSDFSQDEEDKMSDRLDGTDSERSSGNKTYYHSQGSDSDSRNYQSDCDSQNLGSDNSQTECSSTSGHSSSNSTSKTRVSRSSSSSKYMKKEKNASTTTESNNRSNNSHNKSSLQASSKSNSNSRKSKSISGNSEGNETDSSEENTQDSTGSDDSQQENTYNDSFEESSSDMIALSDASLLENKDVLLNQRLQQKQQTGNKRQKPKVKLAP